MCRVGRCVCDDGWPRDYSPAHHRESRYAPWSKPILIGRSDLSLTMNTNQDNTRTWIGSSPYDNSPLHGPVLDRLRAVLGQVRPSQVLPHEITVTGERAPVCIVLIPHRALGGLSLAVWSDANWVRMVWCQVTDLRRHDEIDLGIEAWNQPRTAPNALALLTEAFPAELFRRIHVRFLPKKRAYECLVEMLEEPRPIGLVGRRLQGGEFMATSVETSLSGEYDIGPGLPVPIDNWRKWA